MRLALRVATVLCALALMSAAPPTPAAMPLAYPAAPRGTVTDDYFGTTVADPYRWLEDIDSPQTVAWVTAEGDLTRRYLDAVPERDAIKTAFARLLNYERLSAPFRAGQRWFY